MLALPLRELAALLGAGHLKAVDVTRMYLDRARRASARWGGVMELLESSALARAAELDRIMATTQRPVGPLHGVPISVKDHIHVAGAPIRMGDAE